MSNYRLIDDGYSTFKKIMHGRSWVGRVVRHADGGYYARIGDYESNASTEEDAFREVVALKLGFKDAESLLDHNARVRRTNRARRSYSRHVANQALSGNFEPLISLLEKSLK